MTIKEVSVIEEPIEEVAVEEENVLTTFRVAKIPIKVGQDVCCTADIGELAVMLNLTPRQMIKLLNRGLIRGATWSKEANGDISKIRQYMAEFSVCGFTTYTTS